jgi:hypothetical protein
LWSALLQLFGVVGYASKGEVVGELEGANGQSYVGADLENGSIVFDVVSMEGTKCTQFWWLWEWLAQFEEVGATNLVYVESDVDYFVWFDLFLTF